jgi:hypothetical protein
MFGDAGVLYDIRAPMVSLETLADSWVAEAGRAKRGKHGSHFGIAGVVTPSSDRQMRSAVEWLAHYFRREMGFDNVQFDAHERAEEHKYRAYLWADRMLEDERGRIPAFAAICFRWREPKGDSPYWGAQWAWFHPYARRKGHLSVAWSYFQKRFGKIIPESPLSPAMEAFLRKNRDFRR